MRQAISVAVAVIASSIGAIPPVRADNLLAGTWTIVKAEPAPWADTGTYLADREQAPTFVGKPITFGGRQIEGPDLLACELPNYEMIDAPAAGLFQGQLGELERRGGKKAEDSATEIGFGTRPIKTLRTGCMHSIDFHMSNANHAAFALNNMIYWLERGAH